MNRIVRHSFGIALAKRDHSGRVRVLMVRRRYTYAFYMFVRGMYDARCDQAIIALFDQMTLDEKIDVLSLNFRQLWYRVWLSQRYTPAFADANNKFMCAFSPDGTRALSLIRRSRKFASCIWEIPKGRRKGSETELECAIREFYEETGIPRNAYSITPFIYRVSFIEDGVQYNLSYYVAVTTRDIMPRINSAAIDQISEINNIHWVSGDEIAIYAEPRDVAGLRRIIRYAKKLLRCPLLRSNS